MAAPTPPAPESDPLAFLRRLRAEHGDVVRYATPFGSILLLNDPADVREFLQHEQLVRTDLVKLALGDGLLSSDGPHWRRQRKRVQPWFQKHRLERFGAQAVAGAEATLARWRGTDANSAPFDVAVEMTRLTLEVIVEALFSVRLGARAPRLTAVIATIMEELGHLARGQFGAPVELDAGFRARLGAALTEVDAFAHELVAARRANSAGADPDDLLGLLLTCRDPELSDKELRDEIVTMLISGHETTALILSWTWHLLDRNPEIEVRLHAELEDVLDGRAPELADVEELSTTRRVLEESMRLYPPVWFIGRAATADLRVGRHDVARGETVVVSPWLVHRHPDHWDEPERFDPDRFLPARVAQRDRAAYLPFGGGRHLCLGRTFALIEGVLVLARLAQAVRVRPVAGAFVRPEPLLSLRQRGGLPARLEWRRSARGERAA